MEQNNVIQNIINLLNDQHKTQKNLTDYLGITQNAFTDWKSGRIKSYNKHLPKIAEFLGVSVDYLLGKTDEPSQSRQKTLVPELAQTVHERAVLEAYRAQPELQKAVDKLLGVEDHGKLYLYTAAHSDDRQLDTIISISKEEYNKIKTAPKTDDSLM